MREQGLGTVIKTNNRRRQQQHVTLIWRVFCPRGENVHLLFMEYVINFWKRKIIAIELYSFIYLFIRLSEHLLCARHERWWKLQPLPTASSRAIRERAGPPAWYSYWGESHVSWWKKVTAQKENKVTFTFHESSRPTLSPQCLLPRPAIFKQNDHDNRVSK